MLLPKRHSTSGLPMTAPYLPHSFLLCKRQADQNRNLSDKNGTYHLSNRHWISTAQNTNISTTEMGVQAKKRTKKTRELEFHPYWVILDWFASNGEGKKRDVFYREGILHQIGCRVRKHRDKWQTEHVSTCMKLGHPDWFYISLNCEHFTSGMLGPVTPGSRGLRKVSIENDRLDWALGPRVRWWFHSKGWND